MPPSGLTSESAPLETPRRNGEALHPRYVHKLLVIILHGWRHTPWHLEGVQRLVHDVLPETDFFMPRLPLGFFSNADLAVESRRVADEIQRHCEERERCHGEPYSKIIFVGHSAGATLARSIFLAGCGVDIEVEKPRSIWRWRKRGCKLEQATTHDWPKKVTRILQLAAFNRGWSVNYLSQGFKAVSYALARWAFLLLRPFWGEHWLFQVYRGAPFLNELRLRWQEEFHRHKENKLAWPAVIQLLGSKDALVAPDETIDLATADTFIYLNVKLTNHFTIARVDKARAGRYPPSDDEITERREKIRSALVEDLKHLQKNTEIELPFRPDCRIKDVVFVVHGIRDAGFWTQHIGRTVVARADPVRRTEIKVFMPTYGYFGMGPFLLPWNRRAKAAWFVEHYITTRAQFPNALISYIGHSNGTYLPVSALRQYPSVRFRHLAFAGSVLPRRLDWNAYLRSQPVARVGRVCNFVATSDWVVAFFPRMFEALHFSDLGSAGHNGFKDEAVTNIRYADGGHGVVPEEERLWPALADFILKGDLPAQRPPLITKPAGWWPRVIRFNALFPIVPWLICLLIIASFFAAALWIGTLFEGVAPIGGSFWHGAMFALAVIALGFVLRRV
jgi:predicted esterase